MQNHLKDQTSPYLLQHADNPVDWYPWCQEAFSRAKKEDKPILLSIGYSTCHWCHVMAHESFEDEEIADILNQHFIAIKVDKEERPDIDSIYMTVCQAFTGSGGWPTTIFLTPEQKPFFAGTYFAKISAYGRIGFKELLLQVHERWETNRERLLGSAEEIISILQKDAWKKNPLSASEPTVGDGPDVRMIDHAVAIYKESFDDRFGGFGDAPKFPTPHNLMFLMRYFEKNQDQDALKMVEKTLLQMYRGGLFDHIGGGFCRYSTDQYFLVPHFEKMLYDNALLLSAYCKAFQLTKKQIYLDVAQQTALFVLREMTSPEGAFYSAKDADSEGAEGKYYLFEPSEICQVLGEEAGKAFNRYFDITERGNFEGKSIPNLLHHAEDEPKVSAAVERIDEYRAAVYEYRSHRYALHLDDKILTSWNGLMIAALCSLYRVSGKKVYLDTAVQAWKFICNYMSEKDTLYVSSRNGQRGGMGFLDDYAFSIYALLALYGATLDVSYLERAEALCRKAVSDFYDEEHGGFYLYGSEHEQLVLRPKETYDGAVFSGNSAMAYNLVQLSLLTDDKWMRKLSQDQLVFMSKAADGYPAGYAMYLLALSDHADEPDRITIVRKEHQNPDGLACRIPLDMVAVVRDHPDEMYPLKNDRTTYYVCKGHSCLPPANEFLTFNSRNDTIKQM